MLTAVLWLFILALLTLALGGLWGDYLDNKALRFALAPGFLLVLAWKHVACVLTGAKARESKPFGPGDEILIHADPKLPGLGHPVMATLPFLGAVVVLAVVNYFVLGWSLIRSLPAPPMLPAALAEIGPFFRGLGEYLGESTDMFLYLFGRLGGRGALAVYFTACIVFAIRPCYRDTKFLLLSVAVLAGLALLIDFLGIGFTRRTSGNQDLLAWTEVSLRNLGLLVATAIALLIVSGLSIGSVRLTAWVREGRAREKARRHGEKKEA